MLIYVTMVYGPIAAFWWVFPTKIATSVSLPYHVATAVRRYVAATATALVAADSDIITACGTRSSSR